MLLGNTFLEYKCLRNTDSMKYCNKVIQPFSLDEIEIMLFKKKNLFMQFSSSVVFTLVKKTPVPPVVEKGEENCIKNSTAQQGHSP